MKAPIARARALNTRFLFIIIILLYITYCILTPPYKAGGYDSAGMTIVSIRCLVTLKSSFAPAALVSNLENAKVADESGWIPQSRRELATSVRVYSLEF